LFYDYDVLNRTHHLPRRKIVELTETADRVAAVKEAKSVSMHALFALRRSRNAEDDRQKFLESIVALAKCVCDALPREALSHKTMFASTYYFYEYSFGREALTINKYDGTCWSLSKSGVQQAPDFVVAHLIDHALPILHYWGIPF
jgi:hypothetical protein